MKKPINNFPERKSMENHKANILLTLVGIGYEFDVKIFFVCNYKLSMIIDWKILSQIFFSKSYIRALEAFIS